MSSTTANAVRNIFKLKGTFLPSKESTPRENAISVAMGIAAPLAAKPGSVKQQNIPIGIIIPPMAATTGSIAFLKLESSPTSISLFISSPIEKKNTAISASLMNERMVKLCS
jgi:hypothetical protein